MTAKNQNNSVLEPSLGEFNDYTPWAEFVDKSRQGSGDADRIAGRLG